MSHWIAYGLRGLSRSYKSVFAPSLHDEFASAKIQQLLRNQVSQRIDIITNRFAAHNRVRAVHPDSRAVCTVRVAAAGRGHHTAGRTGHRISADRRDGGTMAVLR